MDSSSEPLSQLIDDYIDWLLAWHRLARAEAGRGEDTLGAVAPPASFTAGRESASASLQDQPAIERIAVLHDQLHTLVRLVLMKTPEGQPIGGEDDDAVVAKYRELMQSLRRLERAFAVAASELDPLTGLRTRAGLRREIEHELSRFTRTGRPFCVVITDIDHFKTINDSHGHDGGDRVLAALANHISRSLRAHDEAFRYGGEEFLLILKEADRDAGLRVIERLRSGLQAKPVTLANGASVAVTLSFGLMVCAAPVTADDMLRRADAALYRAKNEGRDRVVVAD
jgi:diguanylate cyclase